MKSRFFAILGVLSALTLVSSGPARAWDERTHRAVHEAALALIQDSPIGTCLQTSRTLVLEAAVIPDQTEPDAHFFRIDAFAKVGVFDGLAFAEYLKALSGIDAADYEAVVGVHRKLLASRTDAIRELDPARLPKDPAHPSLHEIARMGNAPWRVLHHYNAGVDALRKRDPAQAISHLSAMGHFLTDLAQPFRVTLNNDGQQTVSGNGRGIFNVMESPPAEDGALASGIRSENTKRLQTQGLAGLARERMIPELLKIAADSHARVQSLLDGYVREQPSFASLARPIVIQRLADASFLLARAWLSAHAEAGRPELTACPSNLERKTPKKKAPRRAPRK